MVTILLVKKIGLAHVQQKGLFCIFFFPNNKQSILSYKTRSTLIRQQTILNIKNILETIDTKTEYVKV